MPLAPYPPAPVQAPARAGIGLRFNWVRFPPPYWPEDWWQRNYDLLPDVYEPVPLTERQMRIPPAPVPS